MFTFFKYLKIELIKTKTVLFWLGLLSLVLFFYFLSGIAGIPSNSTWESSVYNDSCISREEFEKLPQEERDAEFNENHPNFLGGYYTHNCGLIKENKIILSNLYTFQAVYSYIFLPIFKKKHRIIWVPILSYLLGCMYEGQVKNTKVVRLLLAH